jgi:hypothetical protein
MAVYPEANPKTALGNATKLFKRPIFQSAMEKIQSEMQSKYSIDREFMVTQLMKLIKSCETTRNFDGSIKPDHTNWNQALKTLANLFGLDDKNININKTVTKIVLKVPQATETTQTALTKTAQLREYQEVKELSTLGYSGSTTFNSTDLIN